MNTVNLMKASHIIDSYRDPYFHENGFDSAGLDIVNEKTVYDLYKSCADYYINAFSGDYEKSYYDDIDGIITNTLCLDDFEEFTEEVQIVIHAFIGGRMVLIPLSNDPVESAHFIEIKNRRVA